MDKVLVAYDGSEQGNDALHLAEALRTAFGSDLLVTVVDESDPIFIDFPPYSDRRRDYFAETLEQAREELAGAAFEERTAAGSVPAELEALAAAEGVGLIVVGSSHRGKLGRVFAGSVGESLLHGAPCAVAVAPHGYAGRRHVATSVVGVGYDGRVESRAALRFGEDLARRIHSGLRLVSVAQPPVPTPEFAPSAGEYMGALRAQLKGQLQEAAATVGDDVSVDWSVHEGEPAHELARAATEFDLLVVGSRGYGPLRRVLLGGVAGRLVGDAPCPLIVLPRQGLDEGER